MKCCNPVTVYVKKTVDFVDFTPSYFPFYVRCGHCVACQVAYSSDWAFRCELEMTLHKKNTCVTLTYDDEHLPENGELVKRDYQLFLKRLRKYFYPWTFRYFGCGEYGSKKGRCHFHIILFGVDFKDKVFFKTSKSGLPVYNSHDLSLLWKKGFATIGDVSRETSFYTAKYLSKLRTPNGKIPPFCFMSLKPSIGFNYFTTEDFERGYIYFKGQKRFIPRSYYLSLKRKDSLYYPGFGLGFDRFLDLQLEQDREINSGELKPAKHQFDKGFRPNVFKKCQDILDKLHKL